MKMLSFAALFVFVASLLGTVSGQRMQNPMRPIQCYACVSGTLSDQSRGIFNRDSQQQQQQSFDVCDDPFQQGNQLLQPCQTSCVKSVTENQFTRVVLRGCLSDVAQQLTSRNPNMVIPAPGSCSENTINTPNLGRVTTRTCVCDNQACNGSSTATFSALLFVLAIASYFAF
ncbi:hypothetical protein M3Y97_00669100 [Aphelenchoides bicaudatus]|nr:hypothetical protein M3Y97_00669100 [Aphelenchoides bicaudatus]